KEAFRITVNNSASENRPTVFFTLSSGKSAASAFTTLSSPELFTVIRNASLLITSSTGPLHLANAARTPLLGFFCPAKPHTPKRWGPYDQQKWVVTPNLDGPEKCELKKCPHGGCLQLLSDLEITAALCEKRLKNLPE
ncbi:MAG TPA: hypothetical protein EYN39_02145, partial [Deltaproteobacteria bacterium]|nr:hypothetical protein [Deltaproteobacteria bacterium]